MVFLVKLFIGLDFRDTQAGLKFFKRGAFKEVLKDIKCKDFSFDVEILWKIKRQGYKIVQVPVKERNLNGSTVNFISVFRMFSSLIKFWIKNNYL